MAGLLHTSLRGLQSRRALKRPRLHSSPQAKFSRTHMHILERALTLVATMDEITSPALLNVPTEVLLLICSFLNPPDVLALRQTCKDLSTLTDKSIWLAMYYSQAREVPVPLQPHTLSSLSRSGDITTAQLESLAMSVHWSALTWGAPRGIPRRLYTGEDILYGEYRGILLSMDVIADRWLLVVYQDATVVIWDIHPESNAHDWNLGFKWSGVCSAGTSPRCLRKQELDEIGLCISSAACLNDHGDGILFAVASQNITKIVQFNFKSRTIETLSTLPTPSSVYKVAAIEATSQTVIFTHSSSMRQLHWPSRHFRTIPLTEEADEELWNGVVGIKFITPTHVLCMKTRSLELYSLPDVFGDESLHARDPRLAVCKQSLLCPTPDHHAGLAETRVLRHKFPEMTYRAASFSIPHFEHVAGSDSLRETIARVSLLACDVLRGLFHYEVTIRIPHCASESGFPRPDSDNTSPDMDVKLVAAHRMAETLDASSAIGSDTPTGRSASGARGFVSSCVLGPQGRRAIWIERQRGNMDRTVFGFTTCRMQGDIPDEAEVASSSAADEGPGVLRIDGRPLHEVRNSYDLGEDLTHCAFSEVTGRVVLGNRRGQLYVL